MPNGDPDFEKNELPALTEFFDRIADPLEAFAARHNLMLTKYYHDGRSWDFNFRHPKGGVGQMEILKSSDDCVKIGYSWWLDDYDRATRSAKHSLTDEVNIENADIEETLERLLCVILAWEVGDWDDVYSGYEDVWHKGDRKVVDSDPLRYPVPTFEGD